MISSHQAGLLSFPAWDPPLRVPVALRYRSIPVFLCLLLLLFTDGPLSAQTASDNGMQAQPGVAASSRAFKYPPFQVFDNLYYVGIGWVAAWLVETSDGLILIDTLYGEHVDPMFEKIRSLGFDPADIRYVFVTHAHFDHCGGAARAKEITGARVGMTAEDWTMFASDADGSSGLPGFPLMETDLVLADEEQVTLGDTTFTFYKTPGHTLGVLSMSFPVRDGENEHRAFMYAGPGLNFSGVDRCEMYIDSVDRILAMDGVEVNIPNHAPMGDVFGRRDRLEERQPGEPHPFVDPDAFEAWLRGQREKAVKKLEREKRRTP